MTTATFRPSAGAVSPCDGPINLVSQNSTWATLLATGGNQGGLESTSSDNMVGTRATTTTNQFSSLNRAFFNFNTASLGANAVISAVRFYVKFNFKQTGLGDDNVHVVSASPASPSSLPNTDFGNIGSTSFASASTSSISTGGGFTTFTLNSDGLAAINKTGITSLALRLGWDFTGSFTGTWSSEAETRLQGNFADSSGTSDDPYIEVDYTISQPDTKTLDISVQGGPPEYIYSKNDANGQNTTTLDIPQAGLPVTYIFITEAVRTTHGNSVKANIQAGPPGSFVKANIGAAAGGPTTQNNSVKADLLRTFIDGDNHNLDLSYTTPYDNNHDQIYSSGWYGGPKFTPTASNISKISFFAHRSSGATAALSVRLHSDNGGVPGTIIKTITLQPNHFPTTDDWVDIDFGGFSVTPGANYYVTFHSAGSTATGYEFAYNSTGGGTYVYSEDGTNWSTIAFGALFKTYFYGGNRVKANIGGLVGSSSKANIVTTYYTGTNFDGTFSYEDGDNRGKQ